VLKKTAVEKTYYTWNAKFKRKSAAVRDGGMLTAHKQRFQFFLGLAGRNTADSAAIGSLFKMCMAVVGPNSKNFLT
jgi:hypothetical protein